MTERYTFYGSKSANTLAYCHKHHKALTPKQLKQKQCLAKQCNALQKYEHPYWDKRDERKANRKARKARLNELYERGRVNGVHSETASANSDRVPTES